jgi:hypothetical protein
VVLILGSFDIELTAVEAVLCFVLVDFINNIFYPIIDRIVRLEDNGY